MLHHLPDNSSIEDIQYHLYVLEKIRKGQDSLLMVVVLRMKKPESV